MLTPDDLLKNTRDGSWNEVLVCSNRKSDIDEDPKGDLKPNGVVVYLNSGNSKEDKKNLNFATKIAKANRLPLIELEKPKGW